MDAAADMTLLLTTEAPALSARSWKLERIKNCFTHLRGICSAEFLRTQRTPAVYGLDKST
jgi:hypothetical protein